MKRENIAILLIIIAPIWWVFWNVYHGWNAHAQSPLEGFTDMMFWIILAASFIVKPISNETKYIFNGSPKVKIEQIKKTKKARE